MSFCRSCSVALRKESVDRNSCYYNTRIEECLSLSARRAWIEIRRNENCAGNGCVALRKESVDRNTRNIITLSEKICVALRKESVDRNPENPMISVDKIPSLSARRAWIEIAQGRRISGCALVALRKESVDRNTMRRDFKVLGLLVALRKESVDRNLL